MDNKEPGQISSVLSGYTNLREIIGNASNPDSLRVQFV